MKKILLFILILSALIFMAGCESTEDESFETFGDDVGYHPFAEPAAANHSAYMAAHSYDFTQCTECHGENLNDPEIRSCYNCHTADNHRVMFVNAGAEHPGYLQTHNWNLNVCYNCHGGQVMVPEAVRFGGACNTSGCHQDNFGGWPSDCNTCHGNFNTAPNDTLNFAPPEDLAGNNPTTFIGVGAHRAHLDNVGIWKPVACTACHTVPSVWNSPGHIDSSLPVQANVSFHQVGPNDQSYSGSDWEHNTASCNSTYCHFDAVPVWTQVDESWNQCGMCHTLPPPPPHVQEDDCSDCHSTVDENMNIIHPENHANGYVNFN